MKSSAESMSVSPYVAAGGMPHGHRVSCGYGVSAVTCTAIVPGSPGLGIAGIAGIVKPGRSR